MIIESVVIYSSNQQGVKKEQKKEHYKGRRIKFISDNQEKVYFFDKSDLKYEATENEIYQAVQEKVNEETEQRDLIKEKEEIIEALQKQIKELNDVTEEEEV